MPWTNSKPWPCSTTRVETRLANLARLLAEEAAPPTPRPQFANNHIHTFYSFSPYSPTAAVWFAREAACRPPGIMDHDSIAGGLEFRRRGKLVGLGVTCGMELRVSFQGTGLETRKLNNPDQAGIAYMAVHSIPPERHGAFQQAIEPYRQARNRRNRQMVDNINRALWATWASRWILTGMCCLSPIGRKEAP